VCYTVAKFGRGASSGFPSVTAIIKGFKVYDPREGGHDPDDRTTWEWSDNPALHLNDFLQSDHYGAGWTVDQSTVSTLADRNDKVIDVATSTVLRTSNLTLDKMSKTETWTEALRGYAACFVVPSEDGIKLIADAPAAVVASITIADMVDNSFRPTRRGLLDNPTAVKVIYTDTSGAWKDATAEIVADGVSAGLLPRIESVVKQPGIPSYQQAIREATLRFKHFYFEDLEVRFDTFDEGLSYLEGDVVHVTHPIGISQNIRLTKITQKSPGRWELAGVEYQPSVYTSAYDTGTPDPDTFLPSPNDVPAITGLAAVEEVYQVQIGVYASRFRITWDDPAGAYPYALLYTVQMKDAGTNKVIWQHTGPKREVVTAALKDYPDPNIATIQLYIIKCWAHTAGGTTGADQTTPPVRAYGKLLPPGNVPSLDGYELGGEVRLFWSPAIDIDIYRYEIRYGTVAATWGNMHIIDQIDSLRLVTSDIPVGTWDFAVRALDSVRQYSAAEARITITVTLDNSAYLADSKVFVAASTTVSSVHQFTKGRVDNVHHFITFDGSSMASAYPNALNTYTEPLAVSHASVNAATQGHTWDIGTDVVAQFRMTYASGFAHVSSLGSDVSACLMLSDNGSDWDEYPSLASKRSARYATFRVESVASATMHFTMPHITIRADVVPREEHGSLESYAKRFAFECDGADTHAHPPNASAINLRAAGYDSKTLEALFVTDANISTRGVIYKHGGISAGINMYVESSALKIGVWSDSSGQFLTTPVKPGSQYHAIMRYGAGNVKLAMNGLSVAATSTDINVISTNTGSIVVGAFRNGTRWGNGSDWTAGIGSVFIGTIFRVMQYNRYTTDSEVSSHTKGVYPSSASLVMDYNFTSGSGSTVTDSSPTANDASITFGITGGWVMEPLGKAALTKNSYYKAQSITVTPEGVQALSPTVDNIMHSDKTSWLTYIHDVDGSAVVASAIWTFKGV
jgi:hypothetical protein